MELMNAAGDETLWPNHLHPGCEEKTQGRHTFEWSIIQNLLYPHTQMYTLPHKRTAHTHIYSFHSHLSAAALPSCCHSNAALVSVSQ